MTDEILFLCISYREALRVEREREQERRFREAMIVHDLAVDALKKALGDGRRAEIDAIVSLHQTPSALCESLVRIAEHIDGRLRDPKDAALLIMCDINAAYAATLRRHAEELRGSMPPATPADKPKKRGLFQLL